MAGTLYLIATPIGNLEDITVRALRLLAQVDLIACEDTRHTRKLLNHYEIKTKCISYHEHNEVSRARELCAQMLAGASVALVSDAGTPGISDPGFDLVQQAIEQGITISPIPGPVAFVSALTISGLPTDRFLFCGFLAARVSERRAQLAAVKELPVTLLFYEAPHRLAAALADMLSVIGNRRAVVARELTKLHEEVLRGTLAELVQRFSTAIPKGEIVVIVDREVLQTPGVNVELDVAVMVQQLENQGVDRKSALKTVARQTGLPKAEVYRRVQAKR
jgi:16S rRNA (cytidine1402-2'-O)-methyltransferase